MYKLSYFHQLPEGEQQRLEKLQLFMVCGGYESVSEDEGRGKPKPNEGESERENYVEVSDVLSSRFVFYCRENYGCEVVCFCADVGQVRGQRAGCESDEWERDTWTL